MEGSAGGKGGGAGWAPSHHPPALPFRQVVLTSFQPGGLVGRLCAPREMVLLRSWRQDADGTFIVLYQSTTHRKARPEKGGLLRCGGWRVGRCARRGEARWGSRFSSKNRGLCWPQQVGSAIRLLQGLLAANLAAQPPLNRLHLRRCPSNQPTAQVEGACAGIRAGGRLHCGPAAATLHRWVRWVYLACAVSHCWWGVGGRGAGVAPRRASLLPAPASLSPLCSKASA